jgi:hypothetical protein
MLEYWEGKDDAVESSLLNWWIDEAAVGRRF